MSTRATYQFNCEDYIVTFYIHYDGYPEGAAHYFLQMLLLNNTKGSLADRFLRANAQAHITGSHESHGDTEYWYTLSCCQQLSLTVQAVNWINDEPKSTIIYEGNLDKFINQYYPHNLRFRVIEESPYQYLLLSLTNSLASVQTLMKKQQYGQIIYPARDALEIASRMMTLNQKFGYENSWKKEVITPVESLINKSSDYLHKPNITALNSVEIYTILEKIFGYLTIHLSEIT